MSLKSVNLLGGFAGAYHHHSRRKRVEGSGMTYFELLDFHASQQCTSYAFYSVKGGPA